MWKKVKKLPEGQVNTSGYMQQGLRAPKGHDIAGKNPGVMGGDAGRNGTGMAKKKKGIGKPVHTDHGSSGFNLE